MDEPWTIRPRRDDDVPGVADLLRATHRSDGYPVVIPADLEAWAVGRDGLAAWVAVDRTGAVVGHVTLTDPDDGPATAQWLAATGGTAADLGVIRRLVVAAEAQRTGLGSRLLRTAVDDAHRRGRRPVLDMSDNLRAAPRLYARHGFTPVDAYDLDVAGHHLRVITYVGPPGLDGPPSRQG